MQLVEREWILKKLQAAFQRSITGEGHCVFLSGEAGMGKSTMVKALCENIPVDCKIYKGYCDALFSPRLLAPLYDILPQIRPDFLDSSTVTTLRAELFLEFFGALAKQKKKALIVFEDVHWADEATIDFIRFFARRITQLPCLFILTYRDDEVHAGHALRNVMGQLPPDSFTRLQLIPLSRDAVNRMSSKKGYSGEEVYTLSGGNPFYVTEILSSYNQGIPENIKDSIISVYNRQETPTREVWAILSVVPDRLETKYLEKIAPGCGVAIDRNLETGILISKRGFIYFKHELFRRTIENSLSPLKRIALNKRILDLFRKNFEENNEIERIIHHAKNANDYDAVVQYAPAGASRAASLGAHIQACRLYLTAIEYYQGNDPDLLILLYESYAYECYLTTRYQDGISYSEKSLKLRETKEDPMPTSSCMRLLSRLWWLIGNRKNAEKFALQAIDLLRDQPASPAKAMAYSNMSQLKMLTDQPELCVEWGEQAIAMARELDDHETLSHALNNVGSVKMNIQSSEQAGIGLLQQSLEIALKNSLHEHAARAFSNMGSNLVKLKNYEPAKKILEEGIKYCEERDLDLWRSNMLSLKASLFLETGEWTVAAEIAENLLKNENQLTSFSINALKVLATIKMRSGHDEVLSLLKEARAKAFETTELQRIVPTLIAMLEYEWLFGKEIIPVEDIDYTIERIPQLVYRFQNEEFAFWLLQARKKQVIPVEPNEGYDLSTTARAKKSAAFWSKTGDPYMECLCLSHGTEEDRRKAIKISDRLGANTVCKKMKLEMRNAGIKKIPRGIRETTRANPHFLTGRELDVLKFLKEGLHNKEIATRLYISVKTVDQHISSIFFKLSVNSRARAVAEAIRQGIIE